MVSLILWLVLMIAHGASAGQVVTVGDAVTLARGMGPLHYANYVNAVVFTMLVTVLLIGMHDYLRESHPGLARAGIAFVPVYCALNVVAYASQVTVLPLLVRSLDGPDAAMYAVLVGEMTQLRATAVMGMINGLAYALLGVPSVAYGIALLSRGALGKAAGWLLIANAAACVLGVVGVVAGRAGLGMGSLLGGVLFTAAVPVLWVLFRRAAAQVSVEGT
jgi:hypothetical protein